MPKIPSPLSFTRGTLKPDSQIHDMDDKVLEEYNAEITLAKKECGSVAAIEAQVAAIKNQYKAWGYNTDNERNDGDA